MTDDERTERAKGIVEAMAFAAIMDQIIHLFPDCKVTVMIRDPEGDKTNVFSTNEDDADHEQCIERLRKELAEKSKIVSDIESGKTPQMTVGEALEEIPKEYIFMHRPGDGTVN